MADDGARTGAAARARYYEASSSWAVELETARRASQRVAWVIAAAACVVAVLEAVALAALLPLKTVVPYTLTVDRQTGYVETVKGLQPGALSQNAAVTQSFLVQYVIARETFDAADLADNYHKVVVWSAGPARGGYQRDMQRANPASPLNLYPATSVVSTTIKSVSQLSPGSALVRFETTRRDNGAPSGEQRSYAAVIAFRYSGAPMTMGDRFLNPLGFHVTSYRRDAETAPGAVGPASVGAVVR
jgi:type IV secretion system protein VirB8